LPSTGGPRRADLPVQPQAGPEDRRVAYPPGDLELQAARGGDPADLALGVHAVAVDGAVVRLDQALAHQVVADLAAHLLARRWRQVVAGVDAPLPLQP